MNSSIDHVENARLDQKNRVPSGKRKSVDSENPEPHAELGNDENQFYSRKKKSRREERDEDELCSAAKLVQCTAVGINLLNIHFLHYLAMQNLLTLLYNQPLLIPGRILYISKIRMGWT